MKLELLKSFYIKSYHSHKVFVYWDAERWSTVFIAVLPDYSYDKDTRFIKRTIKKQGKNLADTFASKHPGKIVYAVIYEVGGSFILTSKGVTIDREVFLKDMVRATGFESNLEYFELVGS